MKLWTRRAGSQRLGARKLGAIEPCVSTSTSKIVLEDHGRAGGFLKNPDYLFIEIESHAEIAELRDYLDACERRLNTLATIKKLIEEEA